MKNIIKFIVLANFGTFCAAALAHHSFQATFDSTKKIQVEGVVTKFSFRNPHIIVNLDVTNADGSTTNWMSEGAAATLMRRAGWSRDTLKAGDLVRVHGDGTHDGSPMVSIASIDILDPGSLAVVRTLSRGEGGRREYRPPTKAAPMPLQLADGRPNLSGAWTNHGMRNGRPRPPDLDFNDAGLATQASWDRANDPQIFCDPPGLVRQAGTTPHPIRITQLQDRVIIEYEEYGGRREIFFAADAQSNAIKTHLGDSVARYGGDSLIIETNNLLGNPASPEGHQLSDQATTVETYKRADSDEYGPVILIEMVVSDPLYLTADAVMTREKMSAGEYQFIENDCQPPLRNRASN